MKNFLIIIALLLCGCVTKSTIIYKDIPVKDTIVLPYRSSVGISNTDRIRGSGTIIYNERNKKMLILTAAHVVDDIQEIFAHVSYSNIPQPLMVKKISNNMDLALLESIFPVKIDGPYAKLSKIIGVVGDHVIAIGCPVGECFTVTDGQISNYSIDGEILYYRFTAPSFFGNSGGGLFNDSGELIGVVDALSTYNLRGSTTVVPGGFFAVSLQTINKFMEIK